MPDPILDPARLAKLERLGGRDLVTQLIDSFTAEAPARRAALAAALVTGDLGSLAAVAHTLVAGAGQLGAAALSAQAREAEEAARRGETAQVLALTPTLLITFDAALAALAQARGTRVTRVTRHRLAVVEDNPDNRLLLQALLDDRYDLDEYEDGPAALEGIPAAVPALILLDVSLPGMDGPEVLKRLKGMPGLDRIRIIALTAHAMAGDRERLLAQGFDDYVAKPIVDEELLYSAIAKLLAPR